MYKGLDAITRKFVDEGSFHFSNVFKPSISSTSGFADMWNDLSMNSGTPKYNAYVGQQLSATHLHGSGNDGIYTGATPPSGQEKRLFTWGARTNNTIAPCMLLLCDYLMFYPLIDLDSFDTQTMDNTLSLPRYSDAIGTRLMVVNHVTSSNYSDVTIVYENQNGVEQTISERILSSTPGQIMNTSLPIGGATAGNRTPFINMKSGDTGIKRVKSFKADVAGGGFCTLVIVKPLAHMNIYEQNTHSELTFVNDKMTLPKIEDDAYLNIVFHSSNGVVSSLQSDLTFITG